MKNAIKIFILLTLVVIAGCSKDNNEPKTSDGELRFRGFDEKQILFWVGGEQRSSGLCREKEMQYIGFSGKVF